MCMCYFCGVIHRLKGGSWEVATMYVYKYIYMCMSLYILYVYIKYIYMTNLIVCGCNKCFILL